LTQLRLIQNTVRCNCTQSVHKLTWRLMTCYPQHVHSSTDHLNCSLQDYRV